VEQANLGAPRFREHISALPGLHWRFSAPALSDVGACSRRLSEFGLLSGFGLRISLFQIPPPPTPSTVQFGAIQCNWPDDPPIIP